MSSALLGDQTVSVTLDTIWGARTISATLQPGDPRTLESAALRLNEALAAGGYDAGLVATALSGGGAGLRVVTGSSSTVRGVSEINLGGVSSPQRSIRSTRSRTLTIPSAHCALPSAPRVAPRSRRRFPLSHRSRRRAPIPQLGFQDVRSTSTSAAGPKSRTRARLQRAQTDRSMCWRI